MAVSRLTARWFKWANMFALLWRLRQNGYEFVGPILRNVFLESSTSMVVFFAFRSITRRIRESASPPHNCSLALRQVITRVMSLHAGDRQFTTNVPCMYTRHYGDNSKAAGTVDHRHAMTADRQLTQSSHLSQSQSIETCLRTKNYVPNFRKTTAKRFEVRSHYIPIYIASEVPPTDCIHGQWLQSFNRPKQCWSHGATQQSAEWPSCTRRQCYLRFEWKTWNWN